jgi:hypothetical protein
MIDAKELLTLLTASAPGLRQAGVREVSFDGVSVKFAPWEPEPDERDDEDSHDNFADPLEDPTLYGGRVPGFTLRSKS